MRCTTASEPASAKIFQVSLRVVDQPRENTVSPERSETLHDACSNFCRCWMPAWFRLAEIVASERGSAH